MFRDTKQEHLNERSRSREAAQTNPELNEELHEREALRIEYLKHLRTRQRIATIEEQFKTYDLLWFVLLLLDFFKP